MTTLTMTVDAPMKTVDLSALTNNRDDVQTLSGQDRGAEARARFELDRLDQSNEPVQIVVPQSIRTISPSFLQGMLTKSISTLGRDAFGRHYVFLTSRAILNQVDDVVERVLGRMH